MVRLLHLIRPVLKWVPEVESPERVRASQRDRLANSMMCMLLFLVLCHTPLFGIKWERTSDSFYWQRVLLPSSRGTVMELGVAPILTSGLLLQILAGSRYIDVNLNNKEDRQLFSGAQKLFGMVLALIEAVGLVATGVYGPLGVATSALVVLQLTVAACLVILLDQMMQKGHGMGPGVQLFIALNACGNIWTKAVSPFTVDTSRGTEIEGAFLSFVQSLYSRSDKFRALHEGFSRAHLPNVTAFAVTFAVFLAVMFFQSWRVELQVKFQKYRQPSIYPIKLLYTNHMPILLLATIVTDLLLLSRLAHSYAPANIFVRLLGSWQVSTEHANAWRPVSGLAYYISPPQTTWGILTDPFHSVLYIAFVLGTCAFVSKLWITVSGSSPGHVARFLRDQQIVMKGHRDHAMKDVLTRYIPPAAVCGGTILGAIVLGGDFFGAVGSGTGLVLAATIVFQYYEMFGRERGEAMANSLVL